MTVCAVCSNPILRRFVFKEGEPGWVHRVGLTSDVDEELDRDHEARP